MTRTRPVATTAERVTRRHGAPGAATSFAGPGTSCRSPAVGSMAPGHGEGDLDPSGKRTETRVRAGGRFLSPKLGFPSCRRGSLPPRPGCPSPWRHMGSGTPGWLSRGSLCGQLGWGPAPQAASFSLCLRPCWSSLPVSASLTTKQGSEIFKNNNNKNKRSTARVQGSGLGPLGAAAEGGATFRRRVSTDPG